MAANTNPIFVDTPNLGVQIFQPADTTAKKTLWTPGADGGILRALSFVSDDTAIVNMDLWIQVSSVDYSIGTIQIAAGSGNTVNTAAINGLNTTMIKAILSPDGSLMLPSGAVLRGSCRATMTAAKTVWAVAQGGDY